MRSRTTTCCAAGIVVAGLCLSSGIFASISFAEDERIATTLLGERLDTRLADQRIDRNAIGPDQKKIADDMKLSSRAAVAKPKGRAQTRPLGPLRANSAKIRKKRVAATE